MNKDIRILINCPDHPKIKKLMRKLGDKAFWCLIKFWCFVAVNKPGGNISSYDSDDIEIGAGWEGGEGLFYSAMVELGLIEETEQGAFVHDWDVHNGWATGAEARSNKAKSAAKARWEKRTNVTSNAPSINEQCNEHEFSNAPTPTPTPTPNPNPKDKSSVKKTRPIPPDFSVTKKMEMWAESKNFNGTIENQTERFINHALSHNRKQADWVAAWRNWMLKSVEFSGGSQKQIGTDSFNGTGKRLII